MEKLTTLSCVALPLAIDNCDTDQIMPKQFLRGIDKKGLARGTFFNMRCNVDGSPKPESIFNRKGFEEAGIILAGPNFGCGSSREHAVWGLLQMGFRAVIAPGFGEIFYSNAFNNGLLAAKVTPEVSEKLFALISPTEPTRVSIDVATRTIAVADQVFSFELGARHQTMLLEGLDMVDATLKELDVIKAFKRDHEAKFAWMAGLPAKAKAALERED